MPLTKPLIKPSTEQPRVRFIKHPRYQSLPPASPEPQIFSQEWKDALVKDIQRKFMAEFGQDRLQ
jgi:hypothetical protein